MMTLRHFCSSALPPLPFFLGKSTSFSFDLAMKPPSQAGRCEAILHGKTRACYRTKGIVEKSMNRTRERKRKKEKTHWDENEKRTSKIRCNKAYGQCFHHSAQKYNLEREKECGGENGNEIEKAGNSADEHTHRTKTDIFISWTQKRLECFRFFLVPHLDFCFLFPFFYVIVTNENHNCEYSGSAWDFCFNDSRLSPKHQMHRIKWILFERFSFFSSYCISYRLSICHWTERKTHSVLTFQIPWKPTSFF